MKSRGKRTVVSGRAYRSGFEATVASALAGAGVEFEYETQRLVYEVPRVYVPDFFVKSVTTPFLLEVKGYFDAEDRRKIIEVLEANPTLDLRLLFQNARNRISRATRSATYAQWATKHGVPWAHGEIPKEWLL